MFERKEGNYCSGVNGWPKFKEQAEKYEKLKFIKTAMNTYIH